MNEPRYFRRLRERIYWFLTRLLAWEHHWEIRRNIKLDRQTRKHMSDPYTVIGE